MSQLDVSCDSRASPDPLAPAQDAIADLFGDIAEFWGFTRTQGRIFGLVFMSPEALGHRDVRDRLQISAGSASMTLASLVSWGVLHRRGRTYVAETDLWKLITTVMQRREREHVDAAIERVRQVRDLLRKTRDPDVRTAFARQRVERLLEFFRLGRSFLDAFVARSPIHHLLDTIAKRAAKFPAILPRWGQDVRVRL